MLIEFREELLSYEYLVHMHSKKSLYSGREQTQWANYQIEYLVRDKIILSRTFDHLLKNPQLGLYYPESFWCLPPWVNHCLSNTHSLNELEQRLKVKLYHGFFSYPVGGMFTARTDALRPLLDYPWTYDHLPQEPISNDGTILHAIERAIPAIAKHAGYNILFYSDRSGQHHTDDSYIFDAYKSLKLESVYSIIDDFDVISFDLFDTLVFRSVTNNDYAKYLLPGSLHIDIDPLKFVSIRNSKEIEIRKSKDFIGDVTIHEVYRAIVKDHFNQLDPDQLADAELEIDMDLIKPKEAIITLMNHCRNLGKYINVVTDTYYSKRQIERILERFDIKVDNLFVSTDIGVRKDNGSMWAHISGIYADKIQTVLHIGDNPVSDCQIPGNYGITSVHLLHPHDRARAEFKLELDGSRFDDEYISRYSDLHSFLSKYPFVEYRSM
jgi:FMN phosphatase YigB (HAD superfamily)